MDDQQLFLQFVQQIQQAAQLNDELAMQILLAIQIALGGGLGAQQAQLLVMQAFEQYKQTMTRVAKFGIKLNYIKLLRGQCPDGQEMQYFKVGGKVCKKCMTKQTMKDGGNVPSDPIEAFKAKKKEISKAKEGEKVSTYSNGTHMSKEDAENYRKYRLLEAILYPMTKIDLGFIPSLARVRRGYEKSKAKADAILNVVTGIPSFIDEMKYRYLSSDIPDYIDKLKYWEMPAFLLDLGKKLNFNDK